MTPELPHPVATAILERRSWRVYTGAALTDEIAGALGRAAELAPSMRGQRSAGVRLVTDPQDVAGVTRAAVGGIIGKGNLWLRSAPPGAYAVLVGDVDGGCRAEDRLLYNVDAAMAGELVALSAASHGLGSCWMAAVDRAAIGQYLGLASGERVPAVLSVGEAGLRKKGSLLAAGWDRVTRLAISRRRKAMPAIAARGRFGSGDTLPPADLTALPGDGRSFDDVLAEMGPSSRFAGDRPSLSDIATVVEAMRLAPSAENAQTWRFVLLEGRHEAARALEAAGLDVGAEDAPGLVIVVLAAPFPLRGVRREEPFALLDHPIALTHAMLTAEVLGLHWALAFDFAFSRVADLVGAPRDHEVTAILALDRGGERVDGAKPDLAQIW